ncbi:MAG TPA: pitrilysin family protein [Rhodothermales bacterium]|nr:insulinase family protein [Bacteroidota bacterium]HRK74469.1 pitrilysin family protein [Rhodothermales bacterium]HRR09112.1 pitrilysin family protein [Rhodothermales bacterium]
MKPFFTLLFLMFVAISGIRAQEKALSIPHTVYTLDNGLTVILHEDRTVPMVTVNVWYHVGSSYEKPKRTGFAHLFEHIMFEGSGNVKEGDFDNLLEAVGGNNNGSTTQDRTDYYETLPANALDLALFLESDRMGYLLEAMSPGKVDGQRDVVKNERRQNTENRPYGIATQTILENFYPKGHPYNWPVIGYMDDLTAASYEDVVEFFKKYYAPNNAVLVIAGDIEPTKTIEKVKHWFNEIPRGEVVTRPTAPAFELIGEKKLTVEDNVQLPRLYLAYQTPALYTPGDAEMDVAADVLAKGKNSRLYKRLVYELQIAQNVSAYQNGNALGGMFMVMATARPGIKLTQLQSIIDEEIGKLTITPPTEREVQRVVNQNESRILRQMESSMNKADMLQSYYRFAGNPDWLNEDFSRYKALQPSDISASARQYLNPKKRVVLSIVPKGKADLAVQ